LARKRSAGHVAGGPNEIRRAVWFRASDLAADCELCIRFGTDDQRCVPGCRFPWARRWPHSCETVASKIPSRIPWYRWKLTSHYSTPGDPGHRRWDKAKSERAETEW